MLNGGSHIVILGLSEGVVIISKVIMISVLLYFKLMWRAGMVIVSNATVKEEVNLF